MMTEVPDRIVLSASDAASVLGRLAALREPDAQAVFYRITSLWLGPQRTHVTYQPSDDERVVLGKITLPKSVVQSHRYVATYRCDRAPDVVVTIRTNTVPPRRRKLKTAGGETRFTLTGVDDLTTTKEKDRMAKTNTSTKAKAKTAVVDEDELADELEGLEELDELEDTDLDETEDEESEEDEADDESEDEDDETEEDLSALTSAQLKAICKAEGIKGVDKKNKAALIALIEEARAADDEEPEDEEEDEPEDDEEEDDSIDLDALSRSELKALIKEDELEVRVTKGMSDDDIREAIRALSEDDADDEDEEPVKPAKKAPSKAKGTGRTPPTPPNRELPKGKLGAEAVATAAGTDARTVRMFLRSERGKAWPKDEALNRYAFTSKQVAEIAKAMANKPKRELAGAAKAAADRKIAGAKPKGKTTGTKRKVK